MNGVMEVQSRIAELQGRIQSLSQPQRTAGSSVAGQQQFSSVLASALGATQTSALGATETSTLALDPAPSASGPTGADLVASAKKYIGVPYKWGGNDPSTGLDCSALVQRAMKDLGVDVPRVVAQQRHLGTEVPSLDQARPGDLIVMGGSRHIGVYVGDGKMLHAPKAGDRVRIGEVYEKPTSIRRVLPDQAAPTGGVDVGAVRPSALRLPGTLPTGVSDRVASYAQLFSVATAKYGLPQGLLAAVAQTESGGNPKAVSSAGALGLMQIMPATARGLGVDPRDPAQAVDGAARLLRDHLRDFGSVDLALAAYNAGPGAVRRYDGIPPYAETQGYVRKVTALLGRVSS